MTTLNVALFGHVHVAFGDQSTPVRLQRTCESVLAYLMLFSNPFCTRDQVITAFWGDHSESAARGCLNTTLWRLRSALEAHGPTGGAYLLALPSGEIGFNWQADYRLDVQEFSKAVEPVLRRPAEELPDAEVAAAEDGLALYRGDLLEAVYLDWALREREAARLKYVGALTRLSDFYYLRRVSDRSIGYALRVLDLDPLREDMHRRVMRVHAESDQRPLAIRQYERCRRLLKVELGIEPMAETTSLYQHIAGVADAEPVLALDLAAFQAALDELDLAQRRISEARSQIKRAMAQARACGVEVEQVRGSMSRKDP